MFESLKKILFNIERNNTNWVNDLEKETFFFKKEYEEKAKHLLTINRLIDLLLETDISKNAAQTANDWIDSDNVHIRENNDFDCTIDYFMSAEPEEQMKQLEEDAPAYATASKYIEDMVPTASEMGKKMTELQLRVSRELDGLMVECANQKGGIAFAMDVLGAINDQNKAFLLEMHDEMKIKNEINLPKEEQDLRDRCAMLADGDKVGNSKSNLLKKIVKEAEDIVICKREIMRRQYAIRFFSWLQNALQETAYTIRKTGSLLDYLRQSNNQQLAKIISNKADGISIGPKALELGDFIATLNQQNVLTLEGEAVEEVKNRFHRYVESNLGRKDN